MSDLSKYNLPSGYHNEAVAICEEFFGNESKFEEWHVRRIESALHKWMCDGARVVESKLTRPNDAKWISVEDEPKKNGHYQIWDNGYGEGFFHDGEWKSTDRPAKNAMGVQCLRVTLHPTHYMPLPTPPKQSSEGE